MKKQAQQKRSIALPTLDSATLIQVTGGGSSGLASGQRQHDPLMLGEKGPFDNV